MEDKLHNLLVICRFWGGESVHLSSSGLHLLTSPSLECSPGPVKARRLKISQTALPPAPNRRPDPYLILQVGHQADKQLERAFIKSQPMGEQRCDPALKPDPPVFVGFVSVFAQQVCSCWASAEAAPFFLVWTDVLVWSNWFKIRTLKVLLLLVKLNVAVSHFTQRWNRKFRYQVRIRCLMFCSCFETRLFLH